MPKAGFKSITVKDTIYDKFFNVYQANKENMYSKGVNSFAGYLTYMLEEMMKKDETFAKFSPVIEQISIDPDRVLLKDNKMNRVIEIKFVQNRLECMFCESKECRHVGYCASIPQVCEIQGNQS